MDKQFQNSYHRLEEIHFWFRCRRELLFNIIKRYSKGSSILDVGCSSGIFLEFLQGQGFNSDELYGIDINQASIDLALQRGLKHCFVMNAEDFDLEKKFDVIVASDNLEHLKNEKKAIDTWHRHLNPGGLLIVFVPAYKSLWSHHDVVNHHFRRYTRKDLESRFQEVHWQPLSSGYWNSLLFPMIWILRKTQNMIPLLRSNKGDLKKLPVANNMLYRILKLEENWVLKMRIPFGVSTFCILKKLS